MSTISVTAKVTDSTGATATSTAQATIADAPAVRFPGDPGPGKIYMGLNDPPSTAQGSWQDVSNAMPVPGLSAHRLYTNAVWSLPTSDMTAAANRGEVPVVSIGYGPYANPQSVPQSAIDSLAQTAKAWETSNPGKPWFLIPGLHEPEDNTQRADGTYDLVWAEGYRSTGRKLVTALRVAGCVQFAVVGAAYMNCTASGGCPGRKWFWWHLDWKGTISGAGGHPSAADWQTGAAKLVQIDCMDIYTPLIGSANWVLPTTQMDTLLNVMAADGYAPTAFGVAELGVKFDPSTPPDYQRRPNAMVNAFDGIIARNGVFIIWWTTGGNSFWSGPAPASDPDDPNDPDGVGEAEEKLKQLVQDPRHAHL